MPTQQGASAVRACVGRGCMCLPTGVQNWVCMKKTHACRWDAAASELVCDELGVAYPVKDGMPNLRPSGKIVPCSALPPTLAVWAEQHHGGEIQMGGCLKLETRRWIQQDSLGAMMQTLPSGGLPRSNT